MSKKYEIEPLDEMVVVRYFRGGLSKGGIAMPDVAGDYRFYIVSIGPNCKRKELKEGDEVMIGAKKESVSFSPPAHLGMSDYMVMHESHVISRIKVKGEAE